MSIPCIDPVYTEVEADYQIFPASPPPCLPDSVTEAPEMLTEDLLDLLTEDDDTILLEES